MWLTKADIEKLDSKIDEILSSIDEADSSSDSFIRKILGSINLEDVRDKVKDANEIQNYEAAIAAVFKDHIEPTVKKLIIAQEQFMGRQANNMDQLSFGRGTVNGLCLILEEFESAWKNHEATKKPIEEPDQSTFFPETPTMETLTQ